MIISTTCFAGAKISVKPQWFVNSHKLGMTSGISVYQALPGPLALNLWGGTGYRPEPIDAVWFGANADLDIQFKSFTISPGFQYRASPHTVDDDNSIGIKFSQKLW